MLKKLLALILALLLSLSLTACGGDLTEEEIEQIAGLADMVISAMGDTAESTDAPDDAEPESPEEAEPLLPEDGSYTTAKDVALYLHLYGRLPENFITKKEARALGWESGGLESYAPGKCIGGDRFGNYEGLLPEKSGRTYTECDIDTLGARSRGAKRIVFSNDGLIYYTEDHYESFTLLYGEE